MPRRIAERVDAIFARNMRDEEIERAAPYGGADGDSGGCAGNGTALVCDPKPRLHIKASVKVLQLWLDSSEVAGPIVYTVAPVAAAFGVAPVAGVPDETRSGVAALVNYFHERNDSMQVLRVALSRRAAPLTQAVVFDVGTPHPMFNAISSARGGLVRYVSTTLPPMSTPSFSSQNGASTARTGTWESNLPHLASVRSGRCSKGQSRPCVRHPA